jgi:hypothetical protein
MRWIGVLITGAALSAGCGGDRPPDVPASGGGSPAAEISAPQDADLHGAPRPDDEDLQELFDVSRDLQAVGRSESGAVADLTDDLLRFGQDNASRPDAKTLAESLGRALKGRSLDDATARRVAVLLYVVMNGDRITAEQRGAAASQLRDVITRAGAAAADAGAVVSQIR